MTSPSLPLRRAAGAGLLGALLMQAGCSSPAVEQYAAEQPRLLLREYFDGPMTASAQLYGIENALYLAIDDPRRLAASPPRSISPPGWPSATGSSNSTRGRTP